MKQVAICVVVNDLYYQTRYCIENLISKASSEHRLYILDNGSKDVRITEYCSDLCLKTNGWFLRIENAVQNAEAKNIVMSKVNEEFCCIFPVNILVNNGWLSDLVSSVEICDGSGIVSISTNDEKLILAPILHRLNGSNGLSHTFKNDYLENVLVDKNGWNDGILFFKTEILQETGLFDESFENKGREEAEFSFRFTANGYVNYYLPKQNAIKIAAKNEVLFPEKTVQAILEVRSKINSMVKTNQYKK